MPLIIALGTNIGNRSKNLKDARELLKEDYTFRACSQIYQSEAVGYTDQPDFYNQVLEFETPPKQNPDEVVSHLLRLEAQLGRERSTPLGPRTIDMDLLFFDLKRHNSQIAKVPHPRLFERAFVVLPLRELPYFKILQQYFDFPAKFDHWARPIEE